MSLAWMRKRTLVRSLFGLAVVGLWNSSAAAQVVATEEPTIELVAAQVPVSAPTGEPHWIWTPTQAEGAIPQGTVYFRKWFTSSQPELAFVQITCDDA